VGPTLTVRFIAIQGDSTLALINHRRAIPDPQGRQPISGEIWKVRANGYTDQGVIKLQLLARMKIQSAPVAI